MTLKRVYELAVHQAITNWTNEDNFRIEHPEDELAKIRTKRAWNEMMEIQRELAKLENAESE